MKQHITKKQWKEISKEEQKIMLKYLLNTNVLAYLNVRWGDCYHMNIGQMSEFLDDMDWNIIFTNNNQFGIPRRKYLCDILWENVKYKLKQ